MLLGERLVRGPLVAALSGMKKKKKSRKQAKARPQLFSVPVSLLLTNPLVRNADTICLSGRALSTRIGVVDRLAADSNAPAHLFRS